MGRKPNAIPAARNRPAGNLHCDVFIVVQFEAIPFFAGNAPTVHIDVIVASTDVCIAGIDGGSTGILIMHLPAVHVEHRHGPRFVSVVIVQLDRAAIVSVISTELAAVQI